MAIMEEAMMTMVKMKEIMKMNKMRMMTFKVMTMAMMKTMMTMVKEIMKVKMRMTNKKKMMETKTRMGMKMKLLMKQQLNIDFWDPTNFIDQQIQLFMETHFGDDGLNGCVVDLDEDNFFDDGSDDDDSEVVDDEDEVEETMMTMVNMKMTKANSVFVSDLLPSTNEEHILSVFTEEASAVVHRDNNGKSLLFT
nr:hypothetical protein [Tanacetum cinerariifolium]GEX46831.1 hypothetical protein [Tanacetum cinerariifolium]